MEKRIITISREFGSGGRELGVKLAESLGIPFYDKELISMAADESDLAEDAFLHYDEKLPYITDPLDRHFYSPFSSVYEVPMSDQIFVAQSRVIRKLAEQGPCVSWPVCGHGSGGQHQHLYLCQDESENQSDEFPGNGCGPLKDGEQDPARWTARRKDYYQYYTGNEWGKAQNYHLCLESGLVGVDGCLKAVLAYLESVQ